MSYAPFDFGKSPLRVGVLGASRIVPKALLEPARNPVLSDQVRVVAIAARDATRARVYAEQHGISRAYGSYEELIGDPEIDAVYNALPASGHRPWTLRALDAGKHVLCEKPFGLDVDEAIECVHAAEENERLLMEAHHWRYHPLVPECEEALRSFDEPFSIEAVFDGSLNNPGDIRLDPALGPGVLMDFGCYLIQWSSWAARILRSARRGDGSVEPVEPRVTRALVTEREPGVDVAAEFALDFDGIGASLRCDMRDGTPFQAFVRVHGKDKTLHFESPLIGEGSRVEVTVAGWARTTHSKGPSTYLGQLQALVAALKSGEPPLTSGEDIVRTQATLDAVYRAGGVIGRRELRERTLARARAR